MGQRPLFLCKNIGSEAICLLVSIRWSLSSNKMMDIAVTGTIREPLNIFILR